METCYLKTLKCSGPPPHRDWTDDRWLLGNKRSARHIGREKKGDAKRFLFLLIIPLLSNWLVWQNGKHPMTVWGGGVKLATALGTELAGKNSKSPHHGSMLNHASRGSFGPNRASRGSFGPNRASRGSFEPNRASRWGPITRYVGNPLCHPDISYAVCW